MSEDEYQALCFRYCRSTTLYCITNAVHSFEKSFVFQRRLWEDKILIAKSLNCSISHLSYGTTRFSLFASLFDSEPFRRCVNEKEGKFEAVICGSSHGLLCFYIATCYPQSHCVGYEVIPSLHDKANSLAELFLKGIGIPNNSF